MGAVHRGRLSHHAQPYALRTGQDVLRHWNADPQGYLRQGQRGAGPAEKVRTMFAIDLLLKIIMLQVNLQPRSKI